jgi:hypothetical protein
MAAGRYDLFIEQGATFRRLLTLKANAVAIDLTGYTVRSQIRPGAGSDTLLHDMTPDLVVTPLTGQIELVIPATDTALFTWKKAVWDLEIVEPGGDVIRVLKGSVTNDLEVTV